jgi:hypothetical protein
MIDSIFNFSPISTPASVSSHSNPLSDYERQNALAFHIETDDYFPFLATLLGFVEETLATGDCTQNLTSIEVEAIRAARKDLQYLHTHCRIEPRS